MLRDLRQSGVEYWAQRTLGRQVVQVVEHQRHGRLDLRKQLAKELARKRSDVVRMQRSERRKVCRAALEFARGMAQVMEEGRDVVIVGIDLVPGGLVIARFDISCCQGPLAASLWPIDP